MLRPRHRLRRATARELCTTMTRPFWVSSLGATHWRCIIASTQRASVFSFKECSLLSNRSQRERHDVVALAPILVAPRRDHDVLLAVRAKLKGHRRRARAGRQGAFPELAACLDVDCAE